MDLTDSEEDPTSRLQDNRLKVVSPLHLSALLHAFAACCLSHLFCIVYAVCLCGFKKPMGLHQKKTIPFAPIFPAMLEKAEPHALLFLPL